MKALVLNGSPRGRVGFTWWLLERFIKGLEKAGSDVEIIDLSDRRISGCIGCFTCWLKTPGRCVHDDDMGRILKSYIDSDALVLATPVYVDGMSGQLKTCLDRMLPLADPHFKTREGHMRHPHTTPHPKKLALVSVCGFVEKNNFSPLIEHVKAICKNFDATYGGAVLRSAAPLIPYIKMRHPMKTLSVLRAAKQAGVEFAVGGRITDTTADQVSAELISKETYIKVANRYFDKQLEKLR